MNFLKNFPSKDKLLEKHKASDVLNVNGHIHTPYSFSAFHDISQIFDMAQKENIKVLGINDFFVSDGYRPFYERADQSKIFPLFNIEFIGLLKSEQEKGIRINDPNNPGRIYFSGKGLNYPFFLPPALRQKLDKVVAESQVQISQMITKANEWFKTVTVPIVLNMTGIKRNYAKELIRERHIAKAIRIALFEKFHTDSERLEIFKKIYGGKECKAALNDIPAIENEIRGNLLKSGGKAYVEEDDNAFMSLDEIIDIILTAGGIPCYPVLLDDKNGSYTEYEKDKDKLYTELIQRKITCIELIPGRNDFSPLKDFVKFFHDKGFIITFGTEHNAPELFPLTVDTRGKKPLDDELKRISFEGCCAIAAHQYLQATGKKGYFHPCGTPRLSDLPEFIKLGNAVIREFTEEVD